MTSEYRILGKVLGNLRIYREFQQAGFDYIVNPATGELHDIRTDNFYGSHNLTIADLGSFIGITNIGILPIDRYRDGVPIVIYDLNSLEPIETYTLNKCNFCFPR
jgi:hypothetical protein